MSKSVLDAPYSAKMYTPPKGLFSTTPQFGSTPVHGKSGRELPRGSLAPPLAPGRLPSDDKAPAEEAVGHRARGVVPEAQQRQVRRRVQLSAALRSDILT